MYTTTDSINGFGNDYNSDYYGSGFATDLVIGIVLGILLCIGTVAFWVWYYHRCARRESPGSMESNVVVQSNTTTPAPVPMMIPPQFMPQGNQYGMPPDNQYGMPQGNQYEMPPGNQYGMPPGNQYGMPPGNQYGMPPSNQYGMPQGNQYENPPAYSPPGSYGTTHMTVAGEAPRSVDVDPRVDVSQKNTLMENQ